MWYSLGLLIIAGVFLLHSVRVFVGKQAKPNVEKRAESETETARLCVSCAVRARDSFERTDGVLHQGCPKRKQNTRTCKSEAMCRVSTDVLMTKADMERWLSTCSTGAGMVFQKWNDG